MDAFKIVKKNKRNLKTIIFQFLRFVKTLKVNIIDSICKSWREYVRGFGGRKEKEEML